VALDSEQHSVEEPLIRSSLCGSAERTPSWSSTRVLLQGGDPLWRVLGECGRHMRPFLSILSRGEVATKMDLEVAARTPT
jgi:hypothetical protein